MARIISSKKDHTPASPLLTFTSHSLEETQCLGKFLMEYSLLRKKNVIAFFGDLASGKTTLIKAMIASLQKTEEHSVVSPTFTYLNIYPTTPPSYHFDLYRLKGWEDFRDLGGEEFFDQGLCFLEWAERISPFLSPNTLKISITHVDENSRHFSID